MQAFVGRKALSSSSFLLSPIKRVWGIRWYSVADHKEYLKRYSNVHSHEEFLKLKKEVLILFQFFFILINN